MIFKLPQHNLHTCRQYIIIYVYTFASNLILFRFFIVDLFYECLNHNMVFRLGQINKLASIILLSHKQIFALQQSTHCMYTT